LQLGTDSFAAALFDEGAGTQAGGMFNPATYEGLPKNKKAIVVAAWGGGGYGPGEARETYSVRDPTVKNVLGLMGTRG